MYIQANQRDVVIWNGRRICYKSFLHTLDHRLVTISVARRLETHTIQLSGHPKQEKDIERESQKPHLWRIWNEIIFNLEYRPT
jgi:hypothetical protein